MASRKLPPNLQEWVVARNKYRLSHMQVYMARQLGLNPAKLGKIANHKQEPWKSPLPEFIEHLYEKRFGTSRPEVVLTLEQVAEASRQKQIARQKVRQDQSDSEQKASGEVA